MSKHSAQSSAVRVQQQVASDSEYVLIQRVVQSRPSVVHVVTHGDMLLRCGSARDLSKRTNRTKSLPCSFLTSAHWRNGVCSALGRGFIDHVGKSQAVGKRWMYEESDGWWNTTKIVAEQNTNKVFSDTRRFQVWFCLRHVDTTTWGRKKFWKMSLDICVLTPSQDFSTCLDANNVSSCWVKLSPNPVHQPTAADLCTSDDDPAVPLLIQGAVSKPL